MLVPVFFNRRDQKSPRISARASMMVPRPGIEPGTRGLPTERTIINLIQIRNLLNVKNHFANSLQINTQPVLLIAWLNRLLVTTLLKISCTSLNKITASVGMRVLFYSINGTANQPKRKIKKKRRQWPTAFSLTTK